MVTKLHKWIGGERVTRQTCFENGEWMQRGDKCIKDSPLIHGVVLRRDEERDDAVWVKWDNGDVKRYLDHGIDEEVYQGN